MITASLTPNLPGDKYYNQDPINQVAGAFAIKKILDEEEGNTTPLLAEKKPVRTQITNVGCSVFSAIGMGTGIGSVIDLSSACFEGQNGNQMLGISALVFAGIGCVCTTICFAGDALTTKERMYRFLTGMGYIFSAVGIITGSIAVSYRCGDDSSDSSSSYY